MRKVSVSIVIVLATAMMAAGIGGVSADNAVTVEFNQAHMQWRGISDFGAWTLGYSYDVYATSSDFVLTGNVLHTEWSYSPLVTELSGQSTVYVYDKGTALWIEKEGQVSYVYEPGYGPFTVVNIFRGYLDFGGNTPSTATFVHGVAYQWVYLFAPEGTTLTGTYTENAVWDSTVGAYLVGFSIYLWDPTPQGYTIAFQCPEPVPSNFNPLNL